MYVRVVRFTGVDSERIAGIREEVAERGGPPEGVRASAMKMLHDEAQGTVVVLQYFDSADDMRASEEALNAMDPSETPGTRASVDRCEVKIEVQA